MNVLLFIEGYRLDMYDDEEIVITKNVQDIRDLGKVLSDYSRSFSLPATPRNNEIFQHYYNVDVDGNFNPHMKAPAQIEAQGVLVEIGDLELTSVTVEGNRPASYSVTYFGKVADLKSVFGEDELNVLDISDLDHELNFSNVTSSWSGLLVGGDITYPFFNYERPWIYSSDAGTSSDNNIANPSYGIQLAELKPAVRVKRIIDNIQSHYNLIFNSPDLFDASWFLKLYMTLHNVAGDNLNEDEKAANMFSARYQPTGGDTLTTAEGIVVIPLTETSDPGNHFNLNTFTVFANGFHTFSMILEGEHTLAGDVRVYIYVNGVQSGNSYLITGTANNTFFSQWIFTRSLVAGDVVTFRYQALTNNALIQFARATLTFFPSLTYGQNTQLNTMWPKMKITDFMQSLCEMFNLVITYNGSAYTFTPLDEYYNDGEIKDYNGKIDRETVTFSKMPIYKKIEFKYNEAKDSSNEIYLNRTGRSYGSNAFVPQVDFADEEITIMPKFSITPLVELLDKDAAGNILGGTGIHYGRMLSVDDKPIIDNPRLFFLSRIGSTLPYYLQNGLSAGLPTFTVRTVVPLCNVWSAQPMATGGKCLNFSLEMPTVGRASATTLYQDYWNKYIQRSFNKKTRLVKVKMRFTVADYLKLALNDKLYFDGHYYTYNNITVNINKEEATAELVSYYPDYIPRRAASVDDLGNVTFDGGSSDLLILEDDLISSTPNGRVVDVSYDVARDTFISSLESAGGGDDKSYVHIQTEASEYWVVTHSLNKYPSVQIVTSANEKVIGDITHTDTNSCVIQFRAAFSGKAFFN